MSEVSDCVEKLLSNEAFKEFVEKLETFVSSSEKDWQEDDSYLKLVEIVNNQIFTKSNERDRKMTTETGLVIAASVLSIIAIALYMYRNKSEVNKNKRNKEAFFETTGKKADETVKTVKNEIKAGFENPNKTQQTAKPPLQPVKETKPTYGQYVLLLIIEAKRLDKKLTQRSTISKEGAEKLISDAMLAYCFAENNTEGQKVLTAVECSDEPVNYESEDGVFLHLSLSAKPEIIDGKRDKLGIREVMNPTQQVEIKSLQKLQTTRSIKAFYSI